MPNNKDKNGKGNTMDDDEPSNRCIKWIKVIAAEMISTSLLDDGWKGSSYGNDIISDHYGIDSSDMGHRKDVLPELVDNKANGKKIT